MHNFLIDTYFHFAPLKKKAGQLMGLPAIYDVLGMYGRDDVTRTRDPYVPNVVRYQLRYISIS